jgi:glyoxylate utilization-related uncharacterized protein
MATTTLFIDTNSLPREKAGSGEFTEILNDKLAGAKNVVGTLRWLRNGEKFEAVATDKHQLIYLMEGSGRVNLENKDYEVSRGAGVYLGPSETATIRAAEGATLKLFHLVVARIPNG